MRTVESTQFAMRVVMLPPLQRLQHCMYDAAQTSTTVDAQMNLMGASGSRRILSVISMIVGLASIQSILYPPRELRPGTLP
jgi:hypothetical protein